MLGRFYDISQIPRGSGNNAQISAYLQNFATSLGLESAVDSAGNVIVRKPAAAGCEAGVPVILEAHYDMVCERTPESRHDFSGPLELCRAGDKNFCGRYDARRGQRPWRGGDHGSFGRRSAAPAAGSGLYFE